MAKTISGKVLALYLPNRRENYSRKKATLWQRIKRNLRFVTFISMWTTAYSIVVILVLLSSGFAPAPTDLTEDGAPYTTHLGVYQERLKVFSVRRRGALYVQD
jgi:hypothetical protein